MMMIIYTYTIYFTPKRKQNRNHCTLISVQKEKKKNKRYINQQITTFCQPRIHKFLSLYICLQSYQ